MDHSEGVEPLAKELGVAREANEIKLSQDGSGYAPAPPTPCPTCTSGPASGELSFVYALGRIEPRCRSLSVEKEYAQVVRRADCAGMTEALVLQRVLSSPENRYLVRQMCWVFSVQGVETYILKPRHPEDFHVLVEAIRSVPCGNDVDLVVGVRGPIAPPEMYNGLTLPIVAFDQIYSFNRDELIQEIPTNPEDAHAEQFRATAKEVFDRIMQMPDNAGATDEHRALNYHAVRHPSIYHKAHEQKARSYALTAVEGRASPLSGARKLVDCIHAYTNRSTDISEKFFVRLDVTEEFPFPVNKLSPYYDPST